MDKYIVVNVSLFGTNTIYISSTDGYSEKLKNSSLNNLSSDIVNFCYNKQIDKVHLFGNELFLKPFVKSIEKENEKYYSNKLNIKVQVN